jgi:hypothetical protein
MKITHSGHGMERVDDRDLVNPRAAEVPGPASWSDDPNCASCARVISATEVRARGLDRCPFCGGNLVWPVDDRDGVGDDTD